jgi:pyruvate dehydrogenase E2 component (dihydrolipoamide acetyltransferase)
VLLPDVERAAAARPVAAAAAEAPAEEAAEAARKRAAAIRGAIAAAMARSKREIPHYYLATPIDLSAALAWLERANLERPVTERLLPAALLLKATALALREAPELNGFWQDGAFRPAGAVHLGVGIAIRGGGLVAPALHDADSKSLDELMAALKDLVRRARAGRLRSSEMTDATATVTNLGDQGVETVFGIVYPPQVALVGFGRIAERPWAEAGVVAARPTVTATLAADHRASDGHQGARFLTRLGEQLQRPETL